MLIQGVIYLYSEHAYLEGKRRAEISKYFNFHCRLFLIYINVRLPSGAVAWRKVITQK